MLLSLIQLYMRIISFSFFLQNVYARSCFFLMVIAIYLCQCFKKSGTSVDLLARVNARDTESLVLDGYNYSHIILVMDAFVVFCCSSSWAFFDKSLHGCHGVVEVSAGGTVVTAVHLPSAHASVRIVAHSAALGQHMYLTVQVQNHTRGVDIEVLPVGQPNLSSDIRNVSGYSGCALSMGCCWYTHDDDNENVFNCTFQRF